MTPSDDLSQPRRQIFFPVVIATVFLTILGMAAGFVLGEQSREPERTGAQQQQQQQQQQEQEQQPPQTAFPAAPSPARRGPSCPRETLRTAGELELSTDLRQVFKIQTENGTTVWICGDENGELYYQSKTGGLKAELVQRKNGLFLSGVREQGEHDYRAVAANGTEFLVDEEHLEVRFADGRVQKDTVVASE